MAGIFILGQILLVTILCVVARNLATKRRGPSLPPGPRPLPLVGNVLDLPPSGTPEWEHWLKHRELYGPVTSITVMGKALVLLHDRAAVTELLDKRGLKNSSRPWTEFAWGLCGFGSFTLGQPYGETFRLHRKLILQYIGTKAAVKATEDVMQKEMGRTLLRFLESPERLTQHIWAHAGALMINLTYGYSVDTAKQDPVLTMLQNVVDIFMQALVPGAWAVDTFPVLKHLPAWAPGAGFKKQAEEWKRITAETVDVPFRFVKQQMSDNTHRLSYVADVLASDGDEKLEQDYEANIKFSAASLYSGGSDTTAATVHFLYLALIQNPHVLKKVHEEIDRVIGLGRLPQLSDRPNLPYIESVLKEAYRWQPATPSGVPHVAGEDQVYGGYLIPKGATLIPNVRWFSRDPAVYHDSESFIPERYSIPFKEPDPKEYVFGFGRRICPGQVFADSSLFLFIAQSLAMFDIGKALDEQGEEIDPVLGYKPGPVCHAKEYSFRLTPRTDQHAKLVRRNAEAVSYKGDDTELIEKLGLLLRKPGS